MSYIGGGPITQNPARNVEQFCEMGDAKIQTVPTTGIQRMKMGRMTKAHHNDLWCCGAWLF